MSGYSKNSLWKKLGIKEGMSIFIKSISKYEHVEYMDGFPGVVRIAREYEEELDFVHLFVDSFEKLKNEVHEAKKWIKKNGMIWISWPKKRSKAGTDITEDGIRELVLPVGLVDVKVCSVTEEFWSGLKIVWRRENR